MDKCCTDVIKRHADELVKKMNVDRVILNLNNLKVLTDETREQLEAERSRYTKSRKLLDMLTTKGRSAFTPFRMALMKAGDFLLAKKLHENFKELSSKQEHTEQRKPLVIDLDKNDEKDESEGSKISETENSQRCMINIGDNYFAVAKMYKGELGIHNRPDTLVEGFYAKINPEYPIVNIRHYWKPDDAEDPVPTKRGVMLNKFRLDNLREVMEKMKDFVPEIEETLPCMYGDDHMNQEGMIRCRECNPFGFEDY
ncbi:hypothetical protein FSP39_001917 [Pinctada imbricata]|uniref:CARD domain-containing protein n=1 Tax=Pinctada imbricata TaxID=66713 RepID=A0AA88YPP8_PINIB|nr:hypothetical protein FSP39_001917 [Pinctada imbricata]